MLESYKWIGMGLRLGWKSPLLWETLCEQHSASAVLIYYQYKQLTNLIWLEQCTAVHILYYKIAHCRPSQFHLAHPLDTSSNHKLYLYSDIPIHLSSTYNPKKSRNPCLLLRRRAPTSSIGQSGPIDAHSYTADNSKALEPNKQSVCQGIWTESSSSTLQINKNLHLRDRKQ